MKYEVDENYPFEQDENGCNIFPDNMTLDGNLYILPNGKYLPPGFYVKTDGWNIIYEPRALSPYADMLTRFTEE